jgi:hypothetical protein
MEMQRYITAPKRAREMAEGVLTQLEDVAAHGLNKVYKNHFYWACDLLCDLPCDEEGRRAAYTWLVKQVAFNRASATILARGGPDYATLFQDGLTPAHETGVLTKNDKDPRWKNRK